MITKGFATDALGEHFDKHRAKLMVTSEHEYEDMADNFLGGALQAPCLEGKRHSGDIVRFNPATGEFGVLGHSGTILTYFKLDPAERVKNLNYFKSNCAR